MVEAMRIQAAGGTGGVGEEFQRYVGAQLAAVRTSSLIVLRPPTTTTWSVAQKVRGSPRSEEQVRVSPPHGVRTPTVKIKLLGSPNKLIIKVNTDSTLVLLPPPPTSLLIWRRNSQNEDFPSTKNTKDQLDGSERSDPILFGNPYGLPWHRVQWQRRLYVILISRPCHRAALVPCAANRHHPPFLLSIPFGWIVGAGS